MNRKTSEYKKIIVNEAIDKGLSTKYTNRSSSLISDKKQPTEKWAEDMNKFLQRRH